MAYNYGYDGENLYLSIPQPDIYTPEEEPKCHDIEDDVYWREVVPELHSSRKYPECLRAIGQEDEA